MVSAAGNFEETAMWFCSAQAGNPMNDLWCEPFFPPFCFELISRYLSVQLGALLKTDFINHNLQTLMGEKGLKVSVPLNSLLHRETPFPSHWKKKNKPGALTTNSN